MKLSNQILTDVFKLIQTTPIIDLNGGIYKNTRPTDSKLEDCVYHLVGGTGAKFLQNGGLYVKIFYLDIFSNNTYYEDTTRGQVLEQMLWNLSELLLKMNGYSFDVRTREIYIESYPEIHQHYVILKINYQITIH